MFKFSHLGFQSNEIFETFENNNFSILQDNLFLRNIKYKNIEILKLISFLVRDKNWNNYNPEIIKTSNYKNDHNLNFEFDLRYGNHEQLEVNILLTVKDHSIKLSAKGKFLTDFWTNRIGFNLLLPLNGVVGEKVDIINSDNSSELSKFPLNISPNQPMVKFNNLSYQMFNSLDLNIKFSGIHFEMEDQRNWGDASYKIYSGSLLDPFPYKENINSAFHQEIEISISDKLNSSLNTEDNNFLSDDLSQKLQMPKIGIKIDHESDFDKNFDVDFIYHIINFEKPIHSNKNLFNKPVYLVALIDHRKNINKIMSDIKEYIELNPMYLDKLLVCPKIYLNSFQPAGEWPTVPSLSAYYKAAKSYFPQVRIFSGMVTNFTELNRKRPDGDFDGINFSFTPIVHDASDYGVLDTPNSLEYIMNTVETFSNDTPVHIGPITLGMHFNPYGEKLADNLNKIRLEMAENDPRHDSLLSLSWSVAVFSQIISKNTEYVTFASMKGVHGIFTDDNQKRPLCYLYELLLYFKNSKIFKTKKIKSIFGLKFLMNEEIFYLLANSSTNQQVMTLDEKLLTRQSHLNESNFSKINDNNFSFFNFEDSGNDFSFEPYEIKLIKVK